MESIPSPPPISKPAVVFLLNEGDNKSTLSDVINAMILEYTHWSDIFMLHSLLDNQKREIEGNKRLIFAVSHSSGGILIPAKMARLAKS